MTKRFKSYLIQLPLLGIVFFTGGLILSYVLFKSNDYWSLLYLPFKLIGVYIAYWICSRGAPGGGVNYHVSEKTKNKTEIKLDKAIAKYSNKAAIGIVAILFSTIYIILNIMNYNASASFQLGEGIFLIVVIFFTVLGFCEGIKYLTAWINIKRN